MRTMLGILALTALAACSSEEAGSGPASESVAESQPAARSGGTNAAVTLPRLAYVYRLGFLLPDAKLAATQDSHAALCAQMGPSRCQLLSLNRGAGEEGNDGATLSLRVATAEAQGFARQLGQSVEQAGGRTADTKVAADDVSKAMIDAEARTRQRELLVARMTEVLRSRTGKLSEIVETERGVAQAQEELDQARTLLADLRGRVAMSRFDLRYASIAPATSMGSVSTQLAEAAQGSGAAFLWGVRSLATLALYLLPWALLAGLPLLLWRRFRRRASNAA